jgi:hypothetical protein
VKILNFTATGSNRKKKLKDQITSSQDI